MPCDRRNRMLDASVSAAGALALAFALTGCGDDATSEPAASATTESSGEVAVSNPGAEQGGASGLSLDQLASAATGGLSAERYEITDDGGIRFIMGQGSVDSTTGLCTGAGTVLPDGTEITLVFPDGELRCD